MPIRSSNSFNANHPLNWGRQAWWLPLPQTCGGTKMYDLMGLCHGTLTSMTGGTSGWFSTMRPGSLAQQTIRCANTSAGVTLAAIPARLRLTWPITIAFWMRTVGTPDNNAGVFGLYVNNSNSSPFLSLALIYTNPNFAIAYDNAGSLATVATTLAVPSSWTHVVVTATTTTSVAAYVNGQLNVSQTNSSATNPTYGATAQMCLGNFVGASRNPNCEIDDCSVWNRLLSPAEIWSLYDQSRRGYPDMLNRLKFRGVPKPSSTLFRRTLFDRAGSRGAA
jgi:hypothetical protein